jgi:hypothetical protein
MLNFAIKSGAGGHYAECSYAESHYTECHYAESHYAERHNVECRGTQTTVWIIVVLLARQGCVDQWCNVGQLSVGKMVFLPFLPKDAEPTQEWHFTVSNKNW